MKVAYIDSQTKALETQVRMYSARLEAGSGNEQEVTTSLTNITRGSTFLVIGLNGEYIAHSTPAKVGTLASNDLGFNTARIFLSRNSFTLVDTEKNILITSYRKALTDPVAVTYTSLNNVYSPVDTLTNTALLQLSISLLLVALGGGVTLFILLTPAIQLSEFTKQLGKKNFLATLNISKFRGELGTIAKSLMDLSTAIQSMIAELENKVLERTHELEQRAIQLRAAADVGKAITSVRNLSELLQQTTILIHERFGYYHVGIFLLDERKEYAVLSASNSEGGRKMLEKNHQLRVSETSIVGYTTLNAKARIALDVGKDAVYFDNPDLPNTRSEMALPLVVSGQILGALDVQSTQQSAFSEEDVVTLQILADQIAVAIQNANLFNETNKALESARQVYGDVSREAWRKILHNQPRVGFIATPPGTTQTYSETLEPSIVKAFETGDVIVGNDNLTISIPIKIRGQAIGALRLKKSDIADAWSQDETNLAIALSDQLSGALESARLYRESQQRAVRESLVSDISARISATTHMEAIIRETVQELGQAIGNATISFQLAEVSTEENQDKGQIGSERRETK
ncbi:MAG: GAF domain-containing protein [Anaerolineales bacterium]